MKPTVLRNEKHRREINRLNSMKKYMHFLDRFLVEDMKYKLDIKQPLDYYDEVSLEVLRRQYPE